MAVNDLDDDILEELKSMNNLLERVVASNENMARLMQEMMEMYTRALTTQR